MVPRSRSINGMWSQIPHSNVELEIANHWVKIVQHLWRIQRSGGRIGWARDMKFMWPPLAAIFFTARNSSCGKVMFSQACVWSHVPFWGVGYQGVRVSGGGVGYPEWARYREGGHEGGRYASYWNAFLLWLFFTGPGPSPSRWIRYWSIANFAMTYNLRFWF